MYPLVDDTTREYQANQTKKAPVDHSLIPPCQAACPLHMEIREYADLVAQGFHAGEIVKQVARVTGGGGGGKAELGQGSGREKSRLDEALKHVGKLVRSSNL